MFGIIFYIILGIMSLTASAAFFIQDFSLRKNAAKKGKDLYVDRRGFTKKIDNDEYIFRTTMNGRSVLVNSNDEIYKDLTSERLHLKEKEQFYKNEAKQNGYSTYLYLSYSDLTSNDMSGTRKETRFEGDRYKDINSNEIYVIRDIKYKGKQGYYYIDISNGHIVREIDNPNYPSFIVNTLNEDDIKNINILIDCNKFYIPFAKSHIKENGRKKYYDR